MLTKISTFFNIFSFTWSNLAGKEFMFPRITLLILHSRNLRSSFKEFSFSIFPEFIVSLFSVQVAWAVSLKLLQASWFHKIYAFKKFTKCFTKKLLPSSFRCKLSWAKCKTQTIFFTTVSWICVHCIHFIMKTFLWSNNYNKHVDILLLTISTNIDNNFYDVNCRHIFIWNIITSYM